MHVSPFGAWPKLRVIHDAASLANAPPWTPGAPGAGKSNSARRIAIQSHIDRTAQVLHNDMNSRRKETLTSILRGRSGISSQLNVDETMNWTNDVDICH